MKIDTIRNGKPVTIEVKNDRIVAASVEPEGEKHFKITKAMRKAVASLNGKRDHTHIDPGLAILCSKEGWEQYGTRHSLETIASFCGCTREAIRRIEAKALRKIRAALYRDKALEKDLKEMFGK